MSTAGKQGTYSELCAASELFGFAGYVFQVDEKNDYTAYEFGHTDNSLNDYAKPTVFLLFSGQMDSDTGHFRLLEPLITPPCVETGIYKLSTSNTSPSGDIIHIELSLTQRTTHKRRIRRITNKNRFYAMCASKLFLRNAVLTFTEIVTSKKPTMQQRIVCVRESHLVSLRTQRRRKKSREQVRQFSKQNASHGRKLSRNTKMLNIWIQKLSMQTLQNFKSFCSKLTNGSQDHNTHQLSSTGFVKNRKIEK